MTSLDNLSDTDPAVKPDRLHDLLEFHKQSLAPDQRGWTYCIDRLLELRSTPLDYLDEEGIDPPSTDTIDQAILVASALQSSLPEPERVVPGGDGDIVFEKRTEYGYFYVEISPDHLVRLRGFSSPGNPTVDAELPWIPATS